MVLMVSINKTAYGMLLVFGTFFGNLVILIIVMLRWKNMHTILCLDSVI